MKKYELNKKYLFHYLDFIIRFQFEVKMHTQLEKLTKKIFKANSLTEKDLIIINGLLQSLPPEIRKVTLAIAIPHWFNVDIIKALCPDIKQTSIEDVYETLQKLPFVEDFDGRGHNIRESTRKKILYWLWTNDQSYFLILSKYAAQYFATQNKLYEEIEYYYHLAISDFQDAIVEIQNYFEKLYEHCMFSELEFLVNSLFELDNSIHLPREIVKKITFWKGRIEELYIQRQKQEDIFLDEEIDTNNNETQDQNLLTLHLHNKNSSGLKYNSVELQDIIYGVTNGI